MKSTSPRALCQIIVGLLTAGASALAQTTSFTYQGRLDDNGRPATGLYEMTFALHDVASGGAPLAGASTTRLTPVTNGLFTVSLDFGSTPFNGNARWMQLSVRTNGSPVAPVPLTPRTAISSVPYAIYAQKAGSVANGAIAAAQIAAQAVGSNQIANYSINGLKLAPGSVVRSLNGLKDDVVLAAGSNISLATNGNVLTLSSTAGGGGGWSLSGGNVYYNNGSVGIGTAVPKGKLDVRGYLTLDAGGDAALCTGTGGTELNRYLNLFNSLDYTSASGLKAGGILVADSYDYARPGKNDLIVKGNVGIGTSLPSAPLEVSADWAATQKPNLCLSGSYPSLEWSSSDATSFSRWLVQKENSNLNFWSRRRTWSDTSVTPTWQDSGWQNLASLNESGDFTITGEFDYGRLAKLDTKEQFTATIRSADLLLGHSARHKIPGRALVDFGDRLVVNFDSDWASTVIGGRVTEVKSLRITGGADLAEPFPMSSPHIPKGAVVVIDPENPGHLAISHRAYDKRVAGIVSGANGINPGIALRQEGALDQGENVALTGRVYVQADATAQPIEPGDLLTTSDTLGHAMRVMDSAKAQGAILGKAMTGLAQGKGMVLVLVTLQ